MRSGRLSEAILYKLFRHKTFTFGWTFFVLYLPLITSEQNVWCVIVKWILVKVNKRIVGNSIIMTEISWIY